MPQRNLEAILDLRAKGYKVCLLSNTNPFMMQWANHDFDGQGHPIDYFFDAMYLSYECKVMKPRREIFDIMLRGQQSLPEETLFVDDGPRNVEAAAALGMHTLCPQNNEDWTAPSSPSLSVTRACQQYHHPSFPPVFARRASIYWH